MLCVSCETLQIDLGGFEALSCGRVLMIIAILLAREVFQQGVESHSGCPGRGPFRVPHGGGLCLVSSSRCADELICLEAGEVFLERKACITDINNFSVFFFFVMSIQSLSKCSTVQGQRGHMSIYALREFPLWFRRLMAWLVSVEAQVQTLAGPVG